MMVNSDLFTFNFIYFHAHFLTRTSYQAELSSYFGAFKLTLMKGDEAVEGGEELPDLGLFVC